MSNERRVIEFLCAEIMVSLQYMPWIASNDIYASSLKRTDNYEFILSVHRIPKPVVPMSYSAYIHITEGYTTIIFSEI